MFFENESWTYAKIENPKSLSFLCKKMRLILVDTSSCNQSASGKNEIPVCKGKGDYIIR